MDKKKMRILLADDDPALCSALALLLETRLNASIVGESGSMESLLFVLKHRQADIVILDWELPGAPKLDRISFLHKSYPTLKVVVMGTQPAGGPHSQALHADAYISKSEPPEKMVRALQAI